MVGPSIPRLTPSNWDCLITSKSSNIPWIWAPLRKGWKIITTGTAKNVSMMFHLCSETATRTTNRERYVNNFCLFLQTALCAKPFLMV